MQNRKGVPDHFQNSGNMNNATEWKCRWLGKIQCTGILNENVTKKEWKWPGNMQRTGILKKKRKWLGKMQHRELVKIFKSWQVCDWLAKWIIMLRFMDLRWPRVFRRSNVGLVIVWVLRKIKSCSNSNFKFKIVYCFLFTVLVIHTCTFNLFSSTTPYIHNS